MNGEYFFVNDQDQKDRFLLENKYIRLRIEIECSPEPRTKRLSPPGPSSCESEIMQSISYNFRFYNKQLGICYTISCNSE